MTETAERMRELAAALAASERERERLAAALERAHARIAELEGGLEAPRASARAPSPRVEPAKKTEGMSAWDRAVASLRQQRGAAEPARGPIPKQGVVRATPSPQPAPSKVAAAPEKPASKPVQRVVEATPEPRPVPLPRERPPDIRPPADGPCLLDVIETDPKLSAGQREALRSTYLRLQPNAKPSADRKYDPALSVGAALDLDPALSRGQREAIRAVYRAMGTSKD